MPFRPGLLRRAQNWSTMDNSRAERDIVCDICVSSEKTCGRAFPHVLEMCQTPAALIFFQQLHRILSWVHNPEDVHLVTHKFGIRLAHQQIKKRSVALRLKFVSVSVIE